MYHHRDLNGCASRDIHHYILAQNEGIKQLFLDRFDASEMRYRRGSVWRLKDKHSSLTILPQIL